MTFHRNAFNIVAISNQAQVLCVNEAKSGGKKTPYW